MIFQANDYQKQILKTLLLQTQAKFSELQPDLMSSKHFNYHLQKLLQNNLLIKLSDGQYALTLEGKEYVGRLDEETMELERQPKVTVAILPFKIESDQRIMLVNRRLKQPYYGKVGGFTGKVRFGETFENAARREFLEETGMTGDFKLTKTVRKLGYDDGGKCVQDQIMFLYQATNLKGELKTGQAELECFWCEESELRKRTDLYNTFLNYLDFSLTSEDDIPEDFAVAAGY